MTFRRIVHRLQRKGVNALEQIQAWRLQQKPDLWPCMKKQFLVVGCESSGTTIIGHLLFNDGSRKFLLAGAPWSWRIYMDVYRGRSSIRDYPRLQLYDGLKVPGFAAVLDKYVAEFPQAEVVYVVRDPRDVVASAYRSKNASSRSELAGISWVAESWLSPPYADPVARLAFRWRTYLEVAEKVPRVHFIRYEDFCAAKVSSIEKIARELAIPCDPERLRGECNRQASHKSVRNYAPHGPGVGRGKWVTPDDERLIADICGAQMRAWNYLT
jgi:Sulfotransferase family